MFELLKTIFKYHRGAITAVALVNIFTFIPAATVFWLEPEKHLYYYGFIAAAAIITSWIFHWTTKEAREMVKYFNVKMVSFLLILAFLLAPVLLTFYFSTAIFFANFFEVIYPNVYQGPDRAVSYLVTFGFYNLFFLWDYVKGLIGLFHKK